MCRSFGPVQAFFWVANLCLSLATIPPTPSPPAVSCPVGETVLSALFFGISEGGLSTRAEELSALSTGQMETKLRDQMAVLVTEDTAAAKLGVPELLDLTSMYYALLAKGKVEADLSVTKDDLRLLLEETVLAEQEDEEKQFLRWNIGSLSDQEVALIGCEVGFIAPAGVTCSDLKEDYSFTGEAGGETTEVGSHHDCRDLCLAGGDSCVAWTWSAASGGTCKVYDGMEVGEVVAGSKSGMKECGGSQVVGVDICYADTTGGDIAELIEVTGSCYLACRRAQYLYHVLSGVGCQCTSNVLSAKSVTDSCTVKLVTTGLGRQTVVRTEFTPADLTPDASGLDTEIVGAKTFYQLRVGELSVILYKKHCAVFSVLADPQAEEDDLEVKTTVEYKDHRRWDADDAAVDDVYDKNNKYLLKPDKVEKPIFGVDDTNEWVKSKKPDATSFTILPIYVKMNEQFHPDNLDMYSDDPTYVDYYDGGWVDTSNMAGRPFPKGKWFNHILITHKSARTRMPSSRPSMTLLRILEDGTLLHILDRFSTSDFGDRGQFEVGDLLLKDPVEVLAYTRGRHSFVMVASNAPTDKLPASAVRGFKMIESTETITGVAKSNFFTADPMNFKIFVFNVAKIGFIDFLFTTYLTVLDRTASGGAASRLRLFSFYRTARGKYTVDEDAVSEVEMPGVFTRMHTFVNKGDRYLVVTKDATSSDDENKVLLYLVDITGRLVLVKEISDKDGVLVDMKPARTGVDGKEVQLIEIRKVSDGAVKLVCKVLRFDADIGEWTYDPLRKASATGILNSDSAQLYTDDRYSTVQVFSRASRVFGLCFRNTDSAASHVDMVRINSVVGPEVDSSRKQESDMVARINMLERRIVADTDSLENNFNTVSDNIDTYIQDSRSVVTGNWDIKTLKVGSVLTVANVPSDTTVTVKVNSKTVKADGTTETVVHTTEDFRKVIDVDLDAVGTMLETVSANLKSLKTQDDDLLLLDTGDAAITQAVSAKVIVDDMEATNMFKILADPTTTIQPQLMIGTLAKDSSSLAMSSLSDIYSTAAESQEISGLTTLTGSVKVNSQLSTAQLSASQADLTTLVTTANLLRYDQDATFTAPQEFGGEVTVSGNMGFAAEVAGTDGATVIDFSKDIAHVSGLLGQVRFVGKVVAGGEAGLVAANLETSFSEINDDRVVPAIADSVEILGKLIINADEEGFSASGNSISIVNAKLNSVNIENLYDNAAWASPPPSKSPPVDSNVFTTKVSFSNSITVNNLDVTILNNVDPAKYVRMSDWDSAQEIVIGGDKTLKTKSNFDEIFAKTFNSETLDKFVTKSTEQDEFSSLNTFSAPTSLVNLVPGGDSSLPTIDGVDMTALLSSDIPSVVSGSVQGNTLGRNMVFTMLKISDTAFMKITGTMNGIDLSDRFPNIVLATESEVTLSGDKTFKNAVAAKLMTTNTFLADLDNAPVTYKLSDFVNRLNSQNISGKKTFEAAVTLGDIFMVGDERKVNSVKVASLLQCWINRLSDDEFIEINNKISFTHLKTPGLNIVREGSLRNCVGMTDSLIWAAIWIDFADGDGGYDDAELSGGIKDYLGEKSISIDLDGLADTGDGGLVALTFFTVILSESPFYKSPEELSTMDMASMRDAIDHYLFGKFGIKLGILAAMGDTDKAELTCRYPELNTKDVYTDLALLDKDNVFGTSDTLVTNTFSGGFVANKVVVKGNLEAASGQTIFGVDLGNLDTSRVSLTKAQTLDGTYSFSDLRLKDEEATHFTGDISFIYKDESLSLGDFIAKFLKKSSAYIQTFTKARKVSKLTASTSVLTGSDDVTKAVAVEDADFDIGTIYGDHDHLDQDFTLTGDFKFTDKLTVGKNIVVSGTVDGVDLLSLAADLVVTGESISITDPSGSGSFSITGVDSGSVAFTGEKSFSVAPSITTNIVKNTDTSDQLVPVVYTFNHPEGIHFLAGADLASATNTIISDSKAQTITGTLSIGGNVLMSADLKTDTVDGVEVSAIIDGYSYDAVNSVHVLKNHFFEGDLVIASLTAASIDDRDWEAFVGDAMPGASEDDVVDTITVGGNKKFSGYVTIAKTDATVNTFNTEDVSVKHDLAAFIDEETEFSGECQFTGPSGLTEFSGPGKTITLATGYHLTAEESLTLTDSTIAGVGSLEWLYNNAVQKDVEGEVTISGKMKFTQDVTLSGDSSTAMLGVYGNADYSLAVPDDLVQLGTTALTTTIGNSHRKFAGVTLNKDIKVTGQLAGYDLNKFSSVLYKTRDQSISGTKTFSKASMTNAVTSNGAVNGLDLNTNLVYLDSPNILQGSYKFEGDVGIMNMDVSGTIDGTDLNSISSKLLDLDTDQTISSTYTFECPALVFSGEIVGDGNDANGEGTINGQLVSELKAVGNTYKRVAAVKVSAQAEAMVLCNHVADLSDAYLDNMAVGFYTAMGTLALPADHSFSAIELVQLGGRKVGLGLSGASLHLLTYASSDTGLVSVENKVIILTQADGQPLSMKATDLVIVPDLIIHQKTTFSFIALLVCEKGMVIVKVVGDGSSTTLSQVPTIVPNVKAVSVVSKLKHILVVTKDSKDSNALSVSSFAKSKLVECANTGLCTSSDWAFNLHWTGADFTKPVLSVRLDSITMSSTNTEGKLVVAFSNGIDGVSGSWVSCFIIDYSNTKGVVTLATSDSDEKLLVPASHDFVLVVSDGKRYLVSGGQALTTTQLWVGSKNWKVVAKVETRGTLTKLRREDSYTVSVMEEAENVVFFKYSGVHGMQLYRRVYATNTPLASFTTLHSPSSVKDNLLMTAGVSNTVAYYESAPTFAAQPVDLQCRHPEVGYPTPVASDYCAVSADHTLCRLAKPSETCNIVKRELTDEFKTEILTRHNSYRSQVAKGLTGVDVVTPAADMRKLVWSDELQEIAQMWADQCTPGHDTNRNTLTGGQVGQNVLAFKGLEPWDVTVSTMTEVVKYWYNEVTEVTAVNLAQDEPKFQFSGDTGHFTQLAWAPTDLLGCGWTQYVDPEEAHPFISLLVCNYYTTGNVPGETMWLKGQACTECPDGWSECDDGLCVKPLTETLS